MKIFSRFIPSFYLFLSEHYRITNTTARRITGINDTLKVSRLLKSRVDKGLLQKIGGKAKKGVYYIKTPVWKFQVVCFQSIHDTDTLIDRIVCKLYALTPDEIGIVERTAGA